MPKLTTSVPKYRKHRASGQAVVNINGKVHYLGLHGSRASKLEYDRLINQWLASGRSPFFGLPENVADSPKLSQVINAYRKWAIDHYRRKDGSETGTADNMRPLMRRLRKWYGSVDADEFTPLALKDVIRRLIFEGLSISTINDAISRIKHMFRWAVSEELLDEKVYRRLQTVSSESAERSKAKARRIVEAVPDSIIEKTLPKMPVVIQAMVQLQRASGMRPAEVVQLRPCDIIKADDVWFYRPEHHKTEHHGKERIVVLGAKAQKILQPYLAQCGTDDYCFSPKKSTAKQLAIRTANRVTPMSCGTKPKKNRKLNGGQCYTSCSYRRAVHRACEAVFKDGYKWSPNQLRHAMARQIDQIAGIEAVAAVLGHSKIDTSKLYAKHNLQLAVKTIQKIG